MMRILVLVLISALALGAGLYLGRYGFSLPGPQPLPDGIVLYDAPRLIGDFKLSGDDGKQLGPEQLRGRWSLMYFGFTHCPDVCPGSLATMNRISEAATGLAIASELDYFLVSVDPERDTPERLRSYVQHFNKGFKGITGDLTDVEQFVKRFGVAAIKVEDDAMPGGYTVDHTSVFSLVSPDGNIVGLFPSPHRVDVITDGLQRAYARFTD